MLKKLTEIEIKAETPFTNDIFQRQEQIELLTTFVKSTLLPFVLSIEAPWGFGKTTFIKLWKAHLESQKHVCFYFNAWENDFVEEPLVAFLGEMRRFIDGEFKGLNEDEPIKKNWDNLKRIGGGVLRKALPVVVQVATHGLLNQEAVKNVTEGIAEDSDKISEFASKLAEERLKKYAVEKDGIAAFRRSLEKLASEISKHADKKPPLIFFVDELDRCRPDFAIALLERIKHLFNVNNVVFVLAIDRHQMNQSVKTLYGVEAKSDGYLRRFIDLAYQLPEPTADAFALNLFNRFSFNNHHLHGPADGTFISSFSAYARAFGLSLRAQEQCFTEMDIALRTNMAIRNFPIHLSFLTTLRAFRPGIIEELQTNQIDIETVLEWIANIADEALKLQAEAALRVEFSKGKKAAKQLQEIQRMIAVGPVPQGQEEAVRRAHQIFGAMHDLQKWSPNVTAVILARLALSSRFR